jgi:hypothetical protein
MDRLYGGYRDPAYLRLRRKWEPWYGAKINDAFAPGSPAVDDRVRFSTNLLRDAGLDGEIECAVDVGGDMGQLFPEISARRRLLVDVSDAPVVQGVERVASLDQLDQKPDLLVVSHVLEHLAEPAQLLRQIRDTIAETGFLYVEVPLDMPSVRPWHMSRSYRRWLELVGGRRSTLVPLDFVTGFARQVGWSVPRFGVIKQSEHINYFGLRSLSTLLEHTSFGVVTSRAEPWTKMGQLRLGRLGVVARPAGVSR